MPTLRKCKETGAILFDLTPEERQIQDMKSELQKLIDEAQQKVSILDSILEKVNKEV